MDDTCTSTCKWLPDGHGRFLFHRKFHWNWTLRNLTLPSADGDDLLVYRSLKSENKSNKHGNDEEKGNVAKFDLSNADIANAKTLVTGPGIYGDIASNETYFVICEHIPDGVSLQVIITAPDGSNVSYILKERISGNLEVCYIPPMSGKYSVEILLNNEHIDGSPFDVQHGGYASWIWKQFAGRKTNNLKQSEPESTDHTYVLLVPKFPAVVGQCFYFHIKTRDVLASMSELSLSVLGPHGEISVEFYKDSFSDFLCYFTPVEEGRHMIQLKPNKVNVIGSPREILVASNVKIITPTLSSLPSDPSKVTLMLPKHFVVFKENYILADATQAGSGYLTAYCKCDGFSDIPVEIYKEDKSVEIFKLVITPTQERFHYLSIYWSDIELPCSPIQIGPPKSTIVVEDPYYCMLMNSVIVMVDCTRAGNGTLTAVCYGKSTGSKEVSVEYLTDMKKYKVSFAPLKDDEYLLDILFNGKQVPDSPLKIIIENLSVLPYIEAKMSPSDVTYTHNPVKISFDIQNKIKGIPTKLAVIVKSSNKKLSEVKLEHDGRSKLKANFKYIPTSPGMYTFEIYCNDILVWDEPFKLIVKSKLYEPNPCMFSTII